MVSLRVDDVEGRDAGELAGDRETAITPRRSTRSGFAGRAARTATAAAADSAAAVRTTPGAPRRSSSGMRTRQPAAAPIRSAAYTALMCDDSRAMASVTTGRRRKRAARRARRWSASAPDCAASSSGRPAGARGRRARRSCRPRRAAPSTPGAGRSDQRSRRRRSDVGEDAAGADAEERDRNREEREVVIHDDREDPRQARARSSAACTRRARRRPGAACPDVQASARSVPFAPGMTWPIPDSSSRVRRRIGDLVGRAAAGDVRVEPAVSADTGLPAVVRHLPRRQPAVSSAAGTIVSFCGASQMPVCARCTGHLRGRGARGARMAMSSLG